MIKGSQVTKEYINSVYSSIDNSISDMEESIAGVYDTSTTLYNYSSTLEDILNDNLLNFTNRIRSISFQYDTSAEFTESFESIDFVDKNFSVDNALTLDTANRSLTLPEENIVKNKIISIVIEPDSNGIPGNSLENYKNSDIRNILDGEIQTIFEYEKFTNIFESAKLNLTATLKLEKISVINSIFVKLFSPDGIQFPVLEYIQISPDAIEWEDVSFTIDTDNPKNDYYIRFIASYARYIRIKINQSVSEIVNTGFGIKNRYSIGIRDVQVMTSTFLNSGDYISIPLSTGSKISTVKFNSEYISNSDIKFYLSGNNGGKWLEVLNGETVNLLERDTGVLMSEDLKTVRVRIAMKRTVSALLANKSQVLGFSSNGEYFLSNVPVELKAYIGGYISFGDICRYNLDTRFPYNVKNEQYLLSGLKYNYTDISFNNNIVIGSPSTSGEAFSIAKGHIMNNTDSYYVTTIKYLPYYEGIESVVDVMVGGQKIKQYYYSDATSGVSAIVRPTYLIMQHENRYHSYIYIDLANLELFLSINSDIYINGNISNAISIKLSQFLYTPDMSAITGKYIQLPYKSLYRSLGNITVIEINEDGKSTMLDNNEHFSLLSNSDGSDTVVLSDSIYSNKASYKISYYPAFDITELLPEVTSSSINLSPIKDAPLTSSVLFDYSYQDQRSSADAKYYSPICKNYTVSFK